MGISAFLAASYVACLLWAVGHWMHIYEAQGANSLFIDHSPLVFHMGVLKHEAIERVMIVVAIRFCAPRAMHFCNFGVTLFWG